MNNLWLIINHQVIFAFISSLSFLTVQKPRMPPLYPFIPLEMTCDAMILNKFVSEDMCYFELLENGDILTKDDTVVEYRHTLSLKQMLSFALSKKQ